MKIKINFFITLIGLLIGAFSYWFQPYNQTTLLGIDIRLIWIVGSFISAFILFIMLSIKPIRIALLITLGVVLAVLVRIIYDTVFWDSTSHNLAPFELIYSGVITIVSGLVGSYLGVVVKPRASK